MMKTLLDLSNVASTTLPDDMAKLSKKERSEVWRKCKDIVERWDCKSALLTNIRPNLNYRVLPNSELKSTMSHNTKTSLLFAMHRTTDSNGQWRSFDSAVTLVSKRICRHLGKATRTKLFLCIWVCRTMGVPSYGSFCIMPKSIF